MSNHVSYPDHYILKGLLRALRTVGSVFKAFWGEHGGSFLLIVFWVFVTIAPLLEQDYPINHSSHFNLSWAFQYQRQFFSGQLYPRWLEYSNFGFGNATFVFYPPLSLVATLPFAALGWSVSESLTGSMTIALLIFGLGFYGYAQCFFKKSTSLILTIVATFNPYFLIDLYQRGTIAEVWGIVWIPWILWFTHKLVLSSSKLTLPELSSSKPSFPFINLSLKRSFYIIGLTLSYSLLMLSHLPTVMLFTLLWILLPWCLNHPNPIQNSPNQNDPRSIHSRTIHSRQGIIESYGSFLLAIGLSSFYLLPAWLDQSLVQLENIHPDADYYPQNRLLITGLTRLLPKMSTHWFDKTIVPYALVVIIVFFVGFLALFLDQQKIKQKVRQNAQINAQINFENQDFIDSQFINEKPIDRSINRSTHLSIYRLKSARKTIHQGAILWWCFTLLVSIVMVTDFGKIFYGLEFLKKIQFSWRWLCVTVVPVPLLLGYIYTVFFQHGQHLLSQFGPRSISRGKTAHTLSQILPLGLTGLLSLVLFIQGNQVIDQTPFDATTIQTFNTLSTQKNFPEEPHLSPQTPFLNWHIRFQDGLGLGDVYEYRSREVQINLPPRSPYPLAFWSNPALETYSDSGTIQVLHWQYGKRSLQINNVTDQPQRVRLRMLYYPGWQFRLNGGPWQWVLPSNEGVAEIAVPPGNHEAIVRYRGTLAESWGKGLTLLTFGILAWILWTSLKPKDFEH